MCTSKGTTCKLLNYYDSVTNVDFLHVYICRAMDSATEYIAGSFEHKPLWLRF